MTAAKKSVAAMLIPLSLLSLLIWTACDCSTTKVPAGTSAEKLRLGTSETDLSALIWVAKSQGYFAEQGLDIAYTLYESGHLALAALLAGHLDLATASEFATVRACLGRPELRIISIIDETRDQLLVARRDRGISQTSDLRNKRIGVARNTSAEYFLNLLLILERIPIQDVTLVDLLPSEQVKAIKKGDIDAMMVWEPFATEARIELGGNGVSWAGQSAQDEYWLLLGTDEIIKKRSSVIQRFVAALGAAEDFIRHNEAQALRLLARQLGAGHVGPLWKNHSFKLDLHRPLIVKMEAQTRWIKSEGDSRDLSMIDLLDFVYLDALHSVRPGRVRIDR